MGLRQNGRYATIWHSQQIDWTPHRHNRHIHQRIQKHNSMRNSLFNKIVQCIDILTAHLSSAMERKWHQNRIDYPISVTSVNPHTLVDVRNNCYLLNSPCAESKRSKTFRFIYLKFGLRATLISISCAVDIIYFEYLFSIKSLCCHDIYFFFLSFVGAFIHSMQNISNVAARNSPEPGRVV